MLATVIVVGLFSVFNWPSVESRLSIHSGDEAVRLRVFYNKQALETGSFININWLGVGTGNFVPWLIDFDPRLSYDLYQPTHNLYLLLYSENGLIGIAVFGLFLSFLIYAGWKKGEDLFSRCILVLLFALLFSALFDHFFWTIQQGRLTLWLVLGAVAGYSHILAKDSGGLYKNF